MRKKHETIISQGTQEGNPNSLNKKIRLLNTFCLMWIYIIILFCTMTMIIVIIAQMIMLVLFVYSDAIIILL